MNENVVFFLKFKKDLQFFYESLSLKEGLTLMKKHGFTAVPVISASGEYVGSVSEGDFLWYLLEHKDEPDLLTETLIKDLIRPNFMPAVNINIPFKDLLNQSLHQNYVPVVDDRNIFIGMVTRQSLLEHFGQQQAEDTLQAIITPCLEPQSNQIQIQLKR
ncbi:CBS domain-containing protein [Erysipelotrichaceae bacterium RD49]|nr:CBS domain-containing protein [Erysipelotrichaceae bacterium RD49]